ncbi:MAG: hypothetical protein AB7T31_07025 [Gemmatimonadales bacterium]
MRPSHRIALLAFVLLPSGAAHAQAWPDVGERVRVRHVDGRTFTGSVESASDDALRLAGPDGAYAIGRSDIAGLERSLGVHRRFGRGFAVTVGIAAGAGGIVSAATWSPCEGWCIVHPETRTDAFAWGVVGGAVIGLPIGVLVGLASGSERWEPILPLGRVALSPVVRAGGRVGVRAAIPLGR